jgi:hypothetical protein
MPDFFVEHFSHCFYCLNKKASERQRFWILPIICLYLRTQVNYSYFCLGFTKFTIVSSVPSKINNVSLETFLWSLFCQMFLKFLVSNEKSDFLQVVPKGIFEPPWTIIKGPYSWAQCEAKVSEISPSILSVFVQAPSPIAKRRTLNKLYKSPPRVRSAMAFLMEWFPVVQLHEFFSNMDEPILKIPKIDESQWFDTHWTSLH